LFQTGLFGACRYRALIRVEYTEVISLAARTGFHAADADHRVDWTCEHMLAGPLDFELGASAPHRWAITTHSNLSLLSSAPVACRDPRDRRRVPAALRTCCHRFATSDANALRTSDCEIPNCRAILDGVIPALKAARTAFNFPWAKETSISSTLFLHERSYEAASFLPRRFCSASTAASNRSNS